MEVVGSTTSLNTFRTKEFGNTLRERCVAQDIMCHAAVHESMTVF